MIQQAELFSQDIKVAKMSLRARVSLILAALSFLPNLFMTAIVFFPSLEEGSISAYEFWWPLLIWLAALAGFSAFISHYFSKELLHPLINMSQKIAEIQKQPNGIVGARIPLEKQEPIEVYQLKNSFNSLIANISKEQDQRSNFVASLMHDLKTPLIACGHLLTVIHDSNDIDKEQRMALISKLNKENKNMIELIQKMVDAHKFERGAIRLVFKEEALEDIANTIIDRLSLLATERGITISLKGQARAQVDKLEFERALYNLLSNAIRYAKTKIELAISDKSIKIIDDGPGLPASLEELVQPFKAQSITIDGQPYNAGSAGLGLFIANKIILAHGGKLVAVNNTEDTTLEIQLEAREAV